METEERDTCGAGERDGLCGSPLYSGVGAALSSATTCHVYRSTGLGRMHHCGSAGRLPLVPPDAWRLCGGRLVHQATDSLEVVACNWRPGRRLGRADLSAGAGRWL